jgi:hypothetical protein
MDPDPASTESPLFKIRITTFPAGGTCIGVLFSHGVMDGEGFIGFMNQWARVHRKEEISPAPIHDQCKSMWDALDAGDVAFDGGPDQPPPNFEYLSVAAGEKWMPPFAPHMPVLMGDPTQLRTSITPFTKNMCN